MAENTQKQLFTELFRPKTLDQAIVLPRIRQELEKGLIDNILFHSTTPGMGKTTLTRIMAYGECSEPLIISASLERGIDIIREKVIQYASTTSLFDEGNHLKVVVLEECDNLTSDAWASLRATIEQFHRNVRFIANCNYVDKVPEPIQSRFNVIPVEPINNEEQEWLFKGYVERAALILNACHITYTQENLENFVKTDFPDMRTLIKKIQQLYTRGVKELTAESLGANFDCSEIFNIIMAPGNTWDNYKVLTTNWGTKADDAMLMIGKQFPTYLQSTHPEKIAKLPLVILAISEYDAQLSTAIDKFVVLLALVYKLQQIMNS